MKVRVLQCRVCWPSFASTWPFSNPSVPQEADQRFGCGYRNVQVAASYLLAQGSAYRSALFAGQGVPSVPSLQQWLEAAWRDNFDPEGAAQLVWA